MVHFSYERFRPIVVVEAQMLMIKLVLVGFQAAHEITDLALNVDLIYYE